ncbi:MAG: hypothetical protein LJE67_15835 [Salaquimonas sp.]|nr:hypothetical protein [Salaquimonas sp.]
MTGRPVAAVKNPVVDGIERATPPMVGLFFTFATLMTTAAAITLILPGGPLDAIWQIKPEQFPELKLHGSIVGAGFVLLALVCAATSVGSFMRRHWGWLLAVTIFTVNFVADLMQAILEPALAAFAGPVVSALILWWLLRSGVRAQFATRSNRPQA